MAVRCFALLSMTRLYLLWQGYTLLTIVTLNAAKGLTRGAPRCFALLSMTGLYLVELSFC